MVGAVSGAAAEVALRPGAGFKVAFDDAAQEIGGGLAGRFGCGRLKGRC
jgi:hypothetical protein